MKAALRWLACSAAYFLASFAAALLARGWDMDQLRSRSALSRAASRVEGVLWWPHDAALQALGPAVLHVPGAVPGLIVLNALLGGALVYGLARMARPRRA